MRARSTWLSRLRMRVAAAWAGVRADVRAAQRQRQQDLHTREALAFNVRHARAETPYTDQRRRIVPHGLPRVLPPMPNCPAHPIFLYTCEVIVVWRRVTYRHPRTYAVAGLRQPYGEHEVSHVPLAFASPTLLSEADQAEHALTLYNTYWTDLLIWWYSDYLVVEVLVAPISAHDHRQAEVFASIFAWERVLLERAHHYTFTPDEGERLEQVRARLEARV